MSPEETLELLKEIETLRARLARLEEQLPAQGGDQFATRPAVAGVLPEEIACPYQALDHEGCLLAVNAAWQTLFGYAASEVIGTCFGDLLVPDSATRFKNCFAQSANKGQHAYEEFEVRRKNGTTVSASFSGRIVRDHSGNVRRVHCIVQDISEHKQARIALGNRNLQLETVRAVAAEITRELDPQRLLSLIALRAAELTGAANCGIYLWDDVTETLIPRAYHGPGSSRPRYPRRLGEGLMGRVAQDRHGMLVNDYRASPFAHPRTLETTDITAVLAEPLLYRDRLCGVIAVDHMGGRGLFTAQDQILLALLADQAAIAIENARLFRIERERRAQLEAVRAVSSEITQELAPTKVLHLVTQRARELTGAAAADIDLWDDDRQLLVPEATYGHAAPRPAATRRLGEGAMGTVAQTRRGIILNDYRSSDIAHPATLAHTKITASLVEPLLYRDTLLGVIGVDHETPGRTFTVQDQELLQLFAAQAAIAIANARLYDETERRRREAEVLASLAQSITASLDLDTVLQRVAEGVKGLCDGDVAAIALRERASDTLAFRTWAGTVTPAYAALRIRAGQGLGGKVLAEGRPIRTANCREDPDIAPEFDEVARTEGFVAEIAVPIRSEGAVAGVLLAIRRTARPFTASDEAILTRLADQAGIAIANARLFQAQQQAYLALQQAQDELVRAEKLRALGQMAAGIAHDLNNRLAVILTQAELIKLRGPSEEIRDGVLTVEAAASEGAKVVRRLQDFARQEGGSTPLSPIDLRGVALEAIELTRPRWQDDAQRRGVLIQIDCSLEGLPHVLGNALEIRDVLANLIFNAVDAMPSGGTISLAGEADPTNVMLTVTDTGVGMSDEVRRRIFEPFFTTKGVKGTGLGLSVVYGIMVRHEGHIAAASRPGHGATFTLRFRRAAEALPQDIPQDLSPQSPRRVLIIDDEPLVRKTVANLLRAAGHIVTEAESGTSGLACLAQGPVDCVLTDLGMPGMTGWEVARAIKGQAPRLPVLLLTGWADHGEEQAEPEAVDRVLHKPLRAGDLLQAIDEVTRTRPAG
jgi:PAS domain S-box-containing protein